MDPAQPDRIHLDQLVADIATAGTREVRLLAASGIYDRASEDVDLAGGIEVTTSDGYRFETPSARVNLERGRVVGRRADRRVGSERHHCGRALRVPGRRRACCVSTGASGSP